MPSATAYVTAMGQLFARSRQRGPIAGHYADELKRRIGNATGVDWHLDDASLLRCHRGGQRVIGARRSPPSSLMLGSSPPGRPDESELLRLARDVDACERQWTGAPVG